MTNKSFKTIISGILLIFGIVMIIFMHQLGELIEVGENLDGKIVYGFNIGFRGICILGAIGAVLVGVTGSIFLKKRHTFMLLGFVAALLDLGMLSYIQYASKMRVMLGDGDNNTAAWDRLEAIHGAGTAFVVILLVVTLALFALEYLRYVKVSWRFERVFGTVLFGVVALDLCLKTFTNFWYVGFVALSVGLAGFAILYDMNRSKQKKFIFYLAAAMIAGGMLVLIVDSVVNKVSSSKNSAEAVRQAALDAYEELLTKPYYAWVDDEMLYGTEDMKFSVIDISGKKGVPALMLENEYSALAFGTHKLLMYKDGALVELWPIGNNSNCIYADSYSETGIFKCSGGRQSACYAYWFELQDDLSLKIICEMRYNMETNVTTYLWDGKEVSEDEYNANYEKSVDEDKLKDIEWFENTEENRGEVFK